jgi:hypothetical protein
VIEPDDVTHTDDNDVKYSYLGNNDYAVWMDKATVPYWRVMPWNNIECAGSIRSVADIAKIAELEKELLLGTKNSIATDLLNVMEKDNVENFSIQVFKVDSGLKRDLQVTCEYLDGVSVSETITNLKEQVAELEKERDELKGDVVVTYKQCGEAESKLEDIEAFFCDEDGCPAIEPFSSKGLAKWLEAHNLEQQAKVINILYKEGKCDADSLEYFKKLKEQGDD